MQPHESENLKTIHDSTTGTAGVPPAASAKREQSGGR
jgi:hypothetical protein